MGHHWMGFGVTLCRGRNIKPPSRLPHPKHFIFFDDDDALA